MLRSVCPSTRDLPYLSLMCRNSRQVAQCAPTAAILYYLQFLYAQHVIVTWPALARSRRCSLFRMLTAIRRGTSITVYSAVYFSLFYRSLFTFARTMVRYTFSLESSLKTDALCYRWCDFLCWMEKLEGITCSFIGIQVLISFPTFFSILRRPRLQSGSSWFW